MWPIGPARRQKIALPSALCIHHRPSRRLNTDPTRMNNRQLFCLFLLLPAAYGWAEEQVLKSDAKLDVAGAAEEISKSSGVSLDSLLPDKTASTSRRRRTNRRQD